MELSSSLISQAREFLKEKILETPVELSPVLSELLGAPVHLKLEFLQLTGSFKVRGALFRLSQLTDEERLRGVATCSAGNHGRAVAYAAKLLGLPVTIYVPSNVDEVKYRAMVSLGANVIRTACEGYDETKAFAKEECKRTNAILISAYDDPMIMAANGGTLAAEVLEEVPGVQSFLVPVGGGGLSAGFSYFIKERHPDATIIGCQHKDSAGLKLSLEEGHAVTKIQAIPTIAGGIQGGLGEKCFEVLKSRINGVALASEDEIKQAVVWMLDHHQYLIEPSAAVVIAACLNGSIKLNHHNAPAVLILSGRNVSLETLKDCLRL